jgi:hypothetical protein
MRHIAQPGPALAPRILAARKLVVDSAGVVADAMKRPRRELTRTWPRWLSPSPGTT